MKILNKLVRDRIPEILSSQGVVHSFRVATEDDYRSKLGEKFYEEMEEFMEAQNVGELADLMEVILAMFAVEEVSAEDFSAYMKNFVELACTINVSPEELERHRKEKLTARGGFGKKLILEYTE